LKASATGAARLHDNWGRATLAAQVALLVLLLTSAGLFGRTLQKLRSIDTGFRQDQVLVVRVFAGPAYRGASLRALYEQLRSRFAALPGVQSVSMTMDTPLGGEPSMSTQGVEVAGRPAETEGAATVIHNLVGPGFFATMRIPIVAGREFEPGDDERGPKCVVISESLMRRYFPGGDALGRQIVFRGVAATIVGVVKDVRYTTVRADAPLVAYYPYRQDTSAFADTFLIRVSSPHADPSASIVQAARAIAPALPPASVVPLEDHVAAGLVQERMLATLSASIGFLAAILAAIGIYSTVASKVARHRREIGVRMALGALPGEIARLVVSETFAIVLVGLAIGVPAAIVAGRAARGLLTGVLFELSPTDPLTLSCVTVAILLVALLAAYLPAQRASRIDPVAAVRCE
jgi:predicted permease